MLGLYSGLYNEKRVCKTVGGAGAGCIKGARPYHSLSSEIQPTPTLPRGEYNERYPMPLSTLTSSPHVSTKGFRVCKHL